MLDGAYRYLYDIAFYFKSRNMLLSSGICCARNELFHRLSAADDRTAGLLYNGNHLSTFSAFIKSHFHSEPPNHINWFHIVVILT